MDEIPSSESTTGSGMTVGAIRLIGLGVLLAGLYSAAQVGVKAWELLENTDQVTRLSESIEKQSHLNAFVGEMQGLMNLIKKSRDSAQLLSDVGHPSAPIPSSTATQNQVAGNPPLFNASYFSAWGIVLVLLALIAKISLWAVREGGKLALYSVNSDKQLKGILRELIAEVRRSGRSG
jgi:hypothetical protein